jgi:hypothetical protein
LNILLHRQLGGALQLILVHGEHLDLHTSDIHQHFLTQFVNGLSSLLLDRGNIMPMLVVQIFNFFF